MKKVKLKVLSNFFDKELDKKVFKNEVFECSEERAKEILSYKAIKLVEIISICK